MHGRHTEYTRVSDEADSSKHAFHFCPECGSQVFYTEPDEPELIVVSVGSFADPSFPPPTESDYEWRRHEWLPVPETIERDPVRALWDPAWQDNFGFFEIKTLTKSNSQTFNPIFFDESRSHRDSQLIRIANTIITNKTVLRKNLSKTQICLRRIKDWQHALITIRGLHIKHTRLKRLRHLFA